jgi:plasmid stabilization system protein ParE
MSSKILFTPEAEEEIAEAFEWYEQHVLGLGAEFLRAVEAAVASAARGPLQYPVWRRGARRVLLRKFPFAIFYTVKSDGIVVFGCFHGKRNPKVLIGRFRKI